MNGKAAKIEFGDFQTPDTLAGEVVAILADRIAPPATVIEPTCGRGSFLIAAARAWPDAEIVGFDRDTDHLSHAKQRLREAHCDARVEHSDFYTTDWGQVVAASREPVLFLGNPPWVTNAGLGVLKSGNLPEKSNYQRHRGFDAKTGKANFDISEWMIVRLLEAAEGRRANIAMLLKTAVARKVLAHAWKTGLHLKGAELRLIDAETHFDAAVAACLLVATLRPERQSRECQIFPNLADPKPSRTIGWRDRFLVADVHAYERSRHLWGQSPLKWRSGIKHDCAKVMEFRHEGGLTNGLGESVTLETDYLFPLLKTSDVARGRQPRRSVLVTQRRVTDPTDRIADHAPRTWRYLLDHATLLNQRSSSIYHNRPRFSVFGVGDYAFRPWKVAISGFYKQSAFELVPPHLGQPVMVDDATYYLGFDHEEDARLVHHILNTQAAQDFLRSMMFMDAKRPVTAELLNRLDLVTLAAEAGHEPQFREALNRCAGTLETTGRRDAMPTLFQ